jgi:hypothetical protein
MTNISFSLGDAGSCLKGTLDYVSTDYAFDFHAIAKPVEHSSIQIASLQIAVDYKGAVLYAYGYCPLLKHRETDLVPPAINRRARLFAHRETEWIPGIAYTIGGPTDWPIWINKRSGWVCLGDPSCNGTIEAIEFATDSIAVLAGARLVAVWLRPKILPDLRPDRPVQ